MDSRCLASHVLASGLLEHAPGQYPQGDDPYRSQKLESLIWGQLVPRLTLLHGGKSESKSVNPPTAEEIEDFGRLVIAVDATAATVFFEKVAARGQSFDSLLETLLAPTARHLGELWEQDLCDFLDVTLGVGRLQELLEVFGAVAGTELRAIKRRALLIATPVEPHIFGLKIVSKFLIAGGWDVQLHDRLPLQKNLDAVAGEWIGIAGFTVGAPEALDGVAHAIEAVRRASFNSEIGIIVGGVAFLSAPELVTRVGADALAMDGPSAVLAAKRLLARGSSQGGGRRTRAHANAGDLAEEASGLNQSRTG